MFPAASTSREPTSTLQTSRVDAGSSGASGGAWGLRRSRPVVAERLRCERWEERRRLTTERPGRRGAGSARGACRRAARRRRAAWRMRARATSAMCCRCILSRALCSRILAHWRRRMLRRIDARMLRLAAAIFSSIGLRAGVDSDTVVMFSVPFCTRGPGDPNVHGPSLFCGSHAAPLRSVRR